MRTVLALVLLAFVTACYHPLEIVGQGNIVSSDGLHDCSVAEQPCNNLITGDYNVTYTAVPHAGWTFTGWEGCGAQYPDCTYILPAASVAQFAGQTTLPLRAVFEPNVVQPNILLILADDLSHDHYGFAGHLQLQTPSIDALAAQSVRFPATYVSSTCRPTFATLLTGLPEHSHGVTYISGPRLGNFPTVTDRLLNAGYSSYQAGKFWEGNPSLRGFTDFHSFDSIFGLGSVELGRTVPLQPIFDFMAETTSPWFIWFSPFMPHAPHDAPSEYRALYEGLGLNAATIEYFAMISWFDAVVGELLQGVDEDTVVIFMADNGYVQSAISEVPEPNSKISSYEHGIRTQLLIRHPSNAASQRMELANAVDVTTTILSIAGAYHDDFPGRALLGPPPSESSAYGSRSPLLFIEPSGTLLERWIRVGDWKLVDVEVGDDRLHNLVLDPDETINEVDTPEHSQLLLDLQNELESWWLE
ncbi:MAG: hypothetical protein ACI9JM_000440 [Halioglobus sp.]|jgi:hypothetical protein